MRWSDERYVRLYTRDTGEWLAFGWEAQALFALALRKCDRAGILWTGPKHARGLAAMVGMPAEVVERALPLLLEGDQDNPPPMAVKPGCILIRNFIEAQEAAQSDAQRQREKRARDRETVTNRDDVVTKRDETVTGCHEQSQGVTPCLAVPSLAVPKQLSVPQTGQPCECSEAVMVRDVFAHYRKLHPRAFRNPQPDGKEWRLIRARLREGSTVEELCQAIDGYHASPYHQGKNDRGTKYLDLGLIVRDGSHVAKGLEFFAQPPTDTEPKAMLVAGGAVYWPKA